MREEEKERLLGLYQYLHSRAHNSSRPLKNIYFTGPRENLLAWVRAVFSVWVTPTLQPRVAEQGWWHKAAPNTRVLLSGVPVPGSGRPAT